jgi:hypothetical protein
MVGKWSGYPLLPCCQLLCSHELQHQEDELIMVKLSEQITMSLFSYFDPWIFLVCFIFFETGSHPVTQSVLELAV